MSQSSSPSAHVDSSKDKTDTGKTATTGKPDPPQSVSTSRALETSASSPSPILHSSRAGSAPTSDTAISEHSPTRPKDIDTAKSQPDSPTSPIASTSPKPDDDVDMADGPASPASNKPNGAAANSESADELKSGSVDQPVSKRSSTQATKEPEEDADSKDDEMRDVSPVASTKTRSRDEEDNTEPAAKRFKTEDSTTPAAAEPSQGQPSEPSASASKPTPAGSAYLAEVMDKKHWDSEPITDAQAKFLLEQIRKAKKTNNGNWYRDPVDPERLKIPTYFDVVKRPMDLSTIENNLKAGAYTSTDHMMEDFDQMLQNSLSFNGPQHPVTQAGFDLKAYFIKLLAFLPSRDQVTFKKTPKVVPPPRPLQARRGSRSKPPAPPPQVATPVKATPPAVTTPSSFALLPNGLPLIRRGSITADRPKREIHRPPPRDLPYSDAKPQKKKFALELRFSRQVINALFKQQHAEIAYPFLAPVDPIALNIPDYHTVVKKPMDFRTIKEKLSNNAYVRAQEVFDDAQLVFSNCFRYNSPDTPVHKMGQALKKVFEREWDKKDAWLAQHAPVAPPEPQVSEEEESEEEEFELKDEADRLEKMRVIQEKISELQAESLRLMNLPTREGAKTKGRPKKSRTETKGKGKGKKGGAPAAAASVPKKEVKPKKIPDLTPEEKQQIADYIALLDPAGEPMAVVIGMIRDGMPNVTEEDDIEISVDDIPNPVLHELLKFVHKQTGPPEPEPEEEEEDDDDSDYVPAKKSRSHGRGKAKSSKQPQASQSKRKSKSKAGDPDRKIQEVTATLARFRQSSEAESPPPHSRPSPTRGGYSPAVESSDDESESESEEE